MNELKLISLFGWLAMLFIAWTISLNRKKFPWRTVIWGAGHQCDGFHAVRAFF